MTDNNQMNDGDIDDVFSDVSDDSHYARQTGGVTDGGDHDPDIDQGLVHPGVDEDTE
jgi:hypothetical protein